jgi:uncharacterized protein (DUF1778 family)
MSRDTMATSGRTSLRISPAEKTLILRAAALQRTNLTEFMVRNAVEAARAVIHAAEEVSLSERDSLRVLEALENPPEPNEKLLRAARAIPETP